jgi:multidrug efflux pump subunit AcrB
MRIKNDPAAVIYKRVKSPTDKALEAAAKSKRAVMDAVGKRKQQQVAKALAAREARNRKSMPNAAGAAALTVAQDKRARDAVVSSMRVRDAMEAAFSGKKLDRAAERAETAKVRAEVSRILQDFSRNVTLGKKLK